MADGASADESFVKSYSVDQVEEYVSAFQRDGYVVIENVLNQEETAKSIDEVGTFVQSHSILLLLARTDVFAGVDVLRERWTREAGRRDELGK